MRVRYLCRTDPETGKFECVEYARNVSTVNSPYIIQDTMSPEVHPCDGKVYDSKAAYERTTTEHGCYGVSPEEARRRFENREQEKRKRGMLEERPEVLHDAIEKAYYGHRDGMLKPHATPEETRKVWEKLHR